LINAAVGDAHPNEFRTFLRGMDALCQIMAKSRTKTAQPGSPTNGDVYILPASATGSAWAGKAAGTIAYYTTQQTTTTSGADTTVSGWDFMTPKQGFYATVADESNAEYMFDGTNWVVMYKESIWTPTPTSIGGTITAYDAKMVQNGNTVAFSIKVTGTGMTATKGTSKLSLGFTAARVSIGMADDNADNGGTAKISGSTINLPNIASTSQINVSGVAFLT
jgi:hypothetical protein